MFHENIVPSVTLIDKILVRQVYRVISGQEYARNLQVFAEEKLVEIGAGLEHTTEITKTPCTKNQHLKIVSSLSYEAV
jgi:hypothetical protein